jgi:hypothetical protein
VNSANLPLPLELTKPVLLAGDLNGQVREAYDAKTALCSKTHSTNQSKTLNFLGIQVDVQADVQVDDVIA